MAIQAYLNFGGNCREAVDFYADAFGAAKQPIMTYGEADQAMPMPENMNNLVMHTTLDMFDSTLMLADMPYDMPLTVGNNVTLMIVTDDVGKIDAAFNKLQVGGEVVMALQQTFWSKRYGYVIDRFGVGWQLNHEDAAAG
jgi:PhnB protein